ncbi:hypothetical protein ON010_g12333 [Phytophthora cinnamomi]|nr:hypothetical protein ON010_g12333 [Phytophthora cinnamomi]
MVEVEYIDYDPTCNYVYDDTRYPEEAEKMRKKMSKKKIRSIPTQTPIRLVPKSRLACGSHDDPVVHHALPRDFAAGHDHSSHDDAVAHHSLPGDLAPRSEPGTAAAVAVRPL